VIRTLLQWGVVIDEAFFLGGLDKTGFLEAFRPHIFFDDQPAHCERAAPTVPTGRVPFPDPPLDDKPPGADELESPSAIAAEPEEPKP
jgi:5'-nucleotidase